MLRDMKNMTLNIQQRRIIKSQKCDKRIEGHILNFQNTSPGAKIINVFRAWIGAQLTICAQK